MTNAVEMLPRIRALYDEWSRSRGNNVDAWMDLLAEDVRMRSLPDGGQGLEFTRHGEGKEAVLRYIAGLAEEWEMLDYTVEHFVAQDDHVVMLGRCTHRNRRTEKVVDTPKADVLRVRDGKIVEFQEFFDTARVSAGAREG